MNELLLPGEAVLLDRSAWALRINACWRKGIEAIIGTGRLLLDAKDSCEHGDFESMLKEDLAFQPRTAQRLMAIARDQRLTNPTHASLLPASWTTLYELTQLTDEEFDRAIEEKVIRPDMERKDVQHIRPTPHRERANETQSATEHDPAQAGEDGPLPASIAEPRDNLAAADPATVKGADGDDQPQAPPATPSDAPAAHMAGRVHPAGDLDFSPTPPWATRALIERVLRHAEREKVCKYQTAWEPACGEGHMAEVLREYFRKVVATDIDPKHGYADRVGDFLDPRNVLVPAADWIITNPPFGDNVLPFIKRALDLAGTGVAMFLQLRYLEGVKRYEQIYRDNPPTIVAPFVERVPLVMGRYDTEASTTTAFMWLVWLKGASPKAPFWIPPGCCEALTKPDDPERFTQKPVPKKEHAVAAQPEPSPPPSRRKAKADFPDLPDVLRRTA